MLYFWGTYDYADKLRFLSRYENYVMDVVPLFQLKFFSTDETILKPNAP